MKNMIVIQKLFVLLENILYAVKTYWKDLVYIIVMILFLGVIYELQENVLKNAKYFH